MKQAKSRNESAVARGIYLGEGTKFCETADKESKKEAWEEQKERQHKQGNKASSGHLKCASNCGLRQLKMRMKAKNVIKS